MRACDGCPRRTETCHADCADYLAERVLAARDGRDRREREIGDYMADAIERGGRRKTGKKTYKANRAHNWKDESGRFGR